MLLTPEDKSRFVLFATEALAFLHEEHGFALPAVNEGEDLWSTTTVTFAGVDVGIEVDIEWKEFVLFVMLVRLDAGKIPQGDYYRSSSGEVIRIYLQAVAQREECAVDQAILARLRARYQNTRAHFNVEGLRAQLEDYVEILRSCIGFILRSGKELFRESGSRG